MQFLTLSVTLCSWQQVQVQSGESPSYYPVSNCRSQHDYLINDILPFAIPSMICWNEANSSSCCRRALAISSSLLTSCIAAAVFTSSTSAASFLTCSVSSFRSLSAFASCSRVLWSSSTQPQQSYKHIIQQFLHYTDHYDIQIKLVSKHFSKTKAKSMLNSFSY